MYKLRNATALSIAHYLTLLKNDSDFSALNNYNINWLIETFEKVYSIFEKNIKKLKKNDREYLIEKFKKDNNFEIFSTIDLKKDKMISAANKKIIQLMMEEKGYYTKDYSCINDVSKIEPSFSIARNAKFMTLEEVGQIYCQMDQELYEKSSYFPYDDYQLQ